MAEQQSHVVGGMTSAGEQEVHVGKKKSCSPWLACSVSSVLTAIVVLGVVWLFNRATASSPSAPSVIAVVGSLPPVQVACGSLISGTGCVSRTAPGYILKAQHEQPHGLTTISDVEHRDIVLSGLAANPGKSLFGDMGFAVGGFGGVFTYEVVEVAEQKMRLYGLRYPDSYSDAWFVDEPTWKTAGDFASYSNNIALTCWNFTMAIRCDVEVGASFVVGSGAWRNTSKGATECDFFPPEQGIKSFQTADPSILQYIMNPAKVANVKPKGCCAAPLAKDDVSKSFDNGCEPVEVSPPPLASQPSEPFLPKPGDAPQAENENKIDLSVYPRMRSLLQKNHYQVNV